GAVMAEDCAAAASGVTGEDAAAHGGRAAVGDQDRAAGCAFIAGELVSVGREVTASFGQNGPGGAVVVVETAVGYRDLGTLDRVQSAGPAGGVRDADPIEGQVNAGIGKDGEGPAPPGNGVAIAVNHEVAGDAGQGGTETVDAAGPQHQDRIVRRAADRGAQPRGAAGHRDPGTCAVRARGAGAVVRLVAAHQAGGHADRLSIPDAAAAGTRRVP